MQDDSLSDGLASRDAIAVTLSVAQCPSALTALDAPSVDEPSVSQADRIVLTCEVALVVTIAFGSSTLYSVFPLFSGGTSDVSRSTYFGLFCALKAATSLSFLAYILFRGRS
jgi:hypothetical protein